MKKIFFLLVLLAFYACGKDEQGHYTNLNGTELMVENKNPDVRTYSLAKSLSLDINNDDVMDVTFTVNDNAERGWGPGSSHSSVTVQTLNGFKVDTIQYSIPISATQGPEIQVFSVPRNYKEGDNILNTNTYTDGMSELVSYSNYSYYINPLLNDKWLHMKEYIVLKKEGSPNDEYGWIKVDVTSYSSIKLLSCFYYKDVSMLKIIDPF
jgi:hypothetical protein